MVGPISKSRCYLTSIVILIIKIRWSQDRFTLIMEIIRPGMMVFILKGHPGPDKSYYHQISIIRHTLVGNKIVDQSDVVGASPVGTAPTTSSFWT